MKAQIKKFLLSLLSPTFGSKRFRRFYMVMKNVSFRGLNYRNTDFNTNGEHFFLNEISAFYKNQKSGESLTLFDVGANVGNYALKLNEAFKCERKIYSFEPFSKVYPALAKLTSEINDFKPCQVGFSNKKHVQKFYSSSAFSEVAGVYEKDFSQFGFVVDNVEEIEFDTLDNFCEQENIKHIDLLKIDVEGHDFFVLEGAKNMLEKNAIDFIQFEFGTVNYLSKTHFYDFFKLLSPNYVMGKLLRNGYIVIDEYNTDIELHLLSNYVAINKSIIAKGFKR
jgi:FkbM family methyltransferase